MDRKEKAFAFAADASKQMITLSTGIIALTVALLKDVVRDPAARTGALELAWLAFGLSVFFGLWFLLALTGSLGSSKITDDDLTINSSNARIPMWGQVICFGAGLILTIIFGMTSLRPAAPPGVNPVAPATRTSDLDFQTSRTSTESDGSVQYHTRSTVTDSTG